MTHIKKTLLFLSLMACANASVQAQQDQNKTKTTQAITQKVRGYVTDAASKQPLAGVIVLMLSNTLVNTVTDSNGYFIMDNVPVGRQSFQFSMMGFELQTIPETMVISGKELELNVSLNENINSLKEITVSGNKNKTRAQNEFATVSARSFSVEETRRYAATFADPARMVMNFPGVSNNGDGDNSIVVRGNSPQGVLWKLEGIEIPNPNHFSAMGSSGGAISMLNANTLGNSDFYTGAFAPEIGNALAGVFDISLRNGNTDQREHTVQIGTLGVEVATEGPLSIGKHASYLLNYRYSTLTLLERFIKLGGVIPTYQDGALKINLPTEKAGTFTLFGLGGYNEVNQKVTEDSSKWTDEKPNVSFRTHTMMGVGGLSHQYFLNKDAYIKTILSASYTTTKEDDDTLNPGNEYAKVPIQHTALTNTALRASVMYNQKINARHTFRTGIIAQQLNYDLNLNYYDDDKKIWKSIFASEGGTQFYQAYLQSKYRLSEQLTLTGGVHGSYLALNGKYSIEPRATMTYLLHRNRFTLAAGLHSKPEHISTYFYHDVTLGQANTYPNKNLDLSRALHLVGGYERSIGKLNLKAEVYYQKLYNIPVERDSSSAFSMLNADNVYALLGTDQPMVSKGTGENYGIDISFEKPFSNNYYIIGTGSLYKSTYTDYSGHTYNTHFNRGYQFNIIGGKEFKLTANGKKLIGLNGKVLYSGGLRESEIDLASSIQNHEMELIPGRYYTQQGPAYFRADASVYYKFNTKRATHSIHLDVQNVTNRENYYFSYFNNKTNKITEVTQMGILPNLSYRIDFHW